MKTRYLASVYKEAVCPIQMTRVTSKRIYFMKNGKERFMCKAWHKQVFIKEARALEWLAERIKARQPTERGSDSGD